MGNGNKILVVDDEKNYIRMISANLVGEGYEVYSAENGKDAIFCASEINPDLILMDERMPILDGHAAVARIREFSSVPIIMVTVQGDNSARVSSLDQGADDYVTKPFSMVELLARIQAVLRRSSKSAQYAPPFFENGDLYIDYASAEVSVDGKKVALSSMEYRLLLQFAHHPGVLISSEQLLHSVWGENYESEKEIMWVTLSRLRRKLGGSQKENNIQTKQGLGYYLPVHA
jgi:two-component system, OmpR family, KDP operon response regulator KdpE